MIDDSSITSGNVSWLGGSTSLQNPLNRALEKSISAHDIPHRVVLTGAYALPFGHPRKFGGTTNRWVDALIGGYEVSGFLTLQSDHPLQVSQSGGNLWNGFAAGTDVFGTAPQYLNYRGPGIKTLDAALLKSWRTKEGQRAELLLEAQNATNTPIFSDPSTRYGATNFGQITGTKTVSRNVQLSFKYYF